METNIHNDVNACKTVEYTETVQEGLKANSGGITVGDRGGNGRSGAEG